MSVMIYLHKYIVFGVIHKSFDNVEQTKQPLDSVVLYNTATANVKELLFLARSHSHKILDIIDLFCN